MESAIQQALLRINNNLSPQEIKGLHETLTACINDLLVNDFYRLVQVLYRVDVSEKKLKTLLEEHKGEDAAPLIATLLIDRQLEKVRTRASFRQNGPISDDDKW